LIGLLLIRFAILRAALGALTLLLLAMFLISLAVLLLAVWWRARLLLVRWLRLLTRLLLGVLLFVSHLLSYLVIPQATLGFQTILSNSAHSNSKPTWGRENAGLRQTGIKK
jgi:hypothetical protein